MPGPFRALAENFAGQFSPQPGSLNGERLLPVGQRGNGNNLSLRFDVGDIQIEMFKTRTRHHSQFRTASNAVEIALGRRVIDSPRQILARNHVGFGAEDHEWEYRYSCVSEVWTHSDCGVPVTTRPKEHIASVHKVAILNIAQLDSRQSRQIEPATRWQVAQLNCRNSA